MRESVNIGLILVMCIMLCSPAWGEEKSGAPNRGRYVPVYLIPASSAPSYLRDEGESFEDVRGNRRDGGLFSSITPVVGTTIFTGPWQGSVSNDFTLGFILNNQIAYPISLELEGILSKNTFGSNLGRYSSYQYSGGLNLRLNFPMKVLHLYVGGGGVYNHYSVLYTDSGSPNHWIVSAKVILGVDVPVAHKFALGVRSAVILPLVNKVRDLPFKGSSFRTGAEAVNSTQFQILGTVSVGF